MLDFLNKFFSKAKRRPHVPQTGHVIAAKVIKIEPHPNADRLRVITLDDSVRTITPVVCGAYNFNEGDIVALALPEAQIARNIHSDEHEPFTLGTAKIRGVESQGMICAAFEIGLSEELSDKPEIMVLPRNTKIGKILQ